MLNKNLFFIIFLCFFPITLAQAMEEEHFERGDISKSAQKNPQISHEELQEESSSEQEGTTEEQPTLEFEEAIIRSGPPALVEDTDDEDADETELLTSLFPAQEPAQQKEARLTMLSEELILEIIESLLPKNNDYFDLFLDKYAQYPSLKIDDEGKIMTTSASNLKPDFKKLFPIYTLISKEPSFKSLEQSLLDINNLIATKNKRLYDFAFTFHGEILKKIIKSIGIPSSNKSSDGYSKYARMFNTSDIISFYSIMHFWFQQFLIKYSDQLVVPMEQIIMRIINRLDIMITTIILTLDAKADFSHLESYNFNPDSIFLYSFKDYESLRLLEFYLEEAGSESKYNQGFLGLLLRKGANPNQLPHDIQSPLEYAINFDSWDTIRTLINYNANIDSTILHNIIEAFADPATEFFTTSIISELLQLKQKNSEKPLIDLNLLAANNRTPELSSLSLSYFIQVANKSLYPVYTKQDEATKDIISILTAIFDFLKAGAQINKQDNLERTPLEYSLIKLDEAEIAKKDLDIDTEIAKKDLDITLYKAITRLLLRNKADINNRDRLGRTPLIKALQNKQPTLPLLLLTLKSIDINAADDEGTTPLMYAIINRNEKVATSLLLKPELNLTAINNAGKTALDIAHNYASKDLTKAIETEIKKRQESTTE